MKSQGPSGVAELANDLDLLKSSLQELAKVVADHVSALCPKKFPPKNSSQKTVNTFYTLNFAVFLFPGALIVELIKSIYGCRTNQNQNFSYRTGPILASVGLIKKANKGEKKSLILLSKDEEISVFFSFFLFIFLFTRTRVVKKKFPHFKEIWKRSWTAQSSNPYENIWVCLH